MYTPSIENFEKFNLANLLSTCFGLSDNRLKPCILIDLDHPVDIKNFEFLSNKNNSVQSKALHEFYNPLNNGIGEELNFSECSLYSFTKTGGSNLDPDDSFYSINGELCSLRNDICPNYDIVLAITDYSLTAPLTALAKEFGFRGATLHGVNDIILNSGLSVNYLEVSQQAESFRKVLDRADSFKITFTCCGDDYSLNLICDQQTAQKSHGLCPPGNPDVANLPAGEVYFVPNNAHGSFPFRFDDGTIAEMIVEDGAIVRTNLISGSHATLDRRNSQLKEDPATGIIGELGFGTQLLPFSGKDIQDEKIFGTCHVATGRSDHLGGNLVPELFASKHNASHDDILFAPPKTPEIDVSAVQMSKDGCQFFIFESYKPSSFLADKLSEFYPMDKLV